MAIKRLTHFDHWILHSVPGIRPVLTRNPSEGLDLLVIDVGLNEGLFGIGLLARMAGKARERIHALRRFHAGGMTAQLLEDCVLSPFVANAIALVDIAAFEASLATASSVLYVFLHANTEDKANVALLPFA